MIRHRFQASAAKTRTTKAIGALLSLNNKIATIGKNQSIKNDSTFPMKKIFLSAFFLSCLALNANAAAPTRTYNYVSNTTVNPVQNNTNENSIFNYLQLGVDTYAAGSITQAAISASAAIPYSKLNLTGSILNADISASAAITGNKIAAGYGVLPSGAVYFMVSGACPTGTTDVSATYSNKFVRINATAGSTGGADTHTHAAGSYGVSGTTGGPSATGGSGGSGASGVTQTHTHDFSASVTGTSASGSNVPAYVTMIACQVN